jgi:hypothetical protein
VEYKWEEAGNFDRFGSWKPVKVRARRWCVLCQSRQRRGDVKNEG